MSKSRTTETTRKLMDMLAESAARDERQRAEIKAALAEATSDWLATLNDQGRTTFFAVIEGAASLSVVRKVTRHPDRPEAVDALVVGAREKQAQQKEEERKQRLKDAEARDLARLAALKEKYEGAALGTAASSAKQSGG